MKKKTLSSILLLCIMTIFSCTEQDPKTSEPTSIPSADSTELVDTQMVTGLDSSISDKPQEPPYNPDMGVKENILQAENSKQLLRVDRMDDGSYRYLCWTGDKDESKKPTTSISGGELVDEGSWGRALKFVSEGITYQLTDYTPAGDPSVNLILKKGNTLKSSTILKTKK